MNILWETLLVYSIPEEIIVAMVHSLGRYQYRKLDDRACILKLWQTIYLNIITFIEKKKDH